MLGSSYIHWKYYHLEISSSVYQLCDFLNQLLCCVRKNILCGFVIFYYHLHTVFPERGGMIKTLFVGVGGETFSFKQ